jgi:hypothetical protein
MGMMSGMGSVMGSGCGVYGIPELFFVTGEARIGAKREWAS